MAFVLKVLLEILRILRFARDYVKQFAGRRASLLALLGRKLTACWRFWCGKSRPYSGRKPVKRPSVGAEASSHSVSGGSTVVGGYVVAASNVPSSASHPSQRERTDQGTDGQQLVPTVVHPGGTHPPVINVLSVDYPLGQNPSSGNLSAASNRSRASDRLSTMITSPDSIRAAHGQSSRQSRATHRQFGRGPRGPDPSRSREPPTRPSSRANTPSIRTRTHTPLNLTPFESTTTLPSAHGTSNRSRRSSTAVDVAVQGPSTESLPAPHWTTNPIADDPLAMEFATAHPSPDAPVVGQHEVPVPGSPISSNAPTLDNSLPEGRFVQLIISEQIPRYEKDALMQVEYTILSPHPYISLQTSHGFTLRCEAFNNYVPLVSRNLNDMVQGSV